MGILLLLSVLNAMLKFGQLLFLSSNGRLLLHKESKICSISAHFYQRVKLT